MPSVDREGSRDRELVLKHQHSFSESGRASVPMWDSSDPERAPPPLPLNPGSSSPAARPNSSALIAAAAEALTARSRESTYTTNAMPNKSPDRSLIKGQYHKRMQSLQNSNGSVRDLSSYLEGGKSPERSPERIPRTPTFDNENRSPERSPVRSGTPTPSAKEFERDTPCLRPSTRPPPKAILGENTPTSATMLALQNMPTLKDPDSSLSNITNGSTSLTRSPQTFDAISTQILGLTSIATNLQREMAQLSRRSKDNATDLISLKEATNARDEDIRKSLRELVSNLSTRMLDPGTDHSSRSASHYNRGRGAYLLDNKPHASPPGMTKSFSLPRIPSPNSFAATIERELANSPSPYSMDGAASLALLEKILREMGTKEGQERLFSTVSALKDKSVAAEGDPEVAKKLEEILAFLKDGSGSRALVSRRDNGNATGDKSPKLRELDFENHPAVLMARSARLGPQEAQRTAVDAQKAYSSPRAADFISEDILKMLKRIKDSVTEGGGLTAEIKALVRELRGEVLGMGREIGRKLEQAESTHGQSNARGDAQGPGREEVAKIVEDGLAELKIHMDRVMRERRRHSSSSSLSRSTVDGQEVYTAVKNALKEMPLQQQVAMQNPGSGIEREDILEAVREAWETYKPEIELQNFGLERDEILQCLKEGLQEYQPQTPSRENGGASYEEVLGAVQKGLQDFKPPTPIETEASITKEEILMSVRECLDAFKFSSSYTASTREHEIIRKDVLDAVKEGLSTQTPIVKEIEFNRDDLFDAVKAGIDGAHTPMAGVGEQVLEKMHELIEGMRGEFKQYSAANGRDTEQVLDAMKDGLEVLRADIETYVDRAADVTGKDEIIDTVREGLEHLRVDLEGTISSAPRHSDTTNSGEILDILEKEFEHLRQTISSSMVHTGVPTANREEILDAIRDGLEEMKNNEPMSRNSQGDTETITVMKEEFEHLRETLATTLMRGGVTTDKEEILETIREGLDSIRADVERPRDRAESVLSNTGELLDALNDGLDGLRIDIGKMVNKPLDMTVNYEILDALKEGLANVRAEIDGLRMARRGDGDSIGNTGGEVVVAEEDGLQPEEKLRRDDIENLEIMITQLRIKVESLDNMPHPAPAPQPAAGTVMKEDLDGIEAMLREMQTSIEELKCRERAQGENTVTKDDTDAIETLLRNTKAKLDEMVEPEGMGRTEHLESVESIVKGTYAAVEDVATRLETDGASKEDISVLEGLLREVQIGLVEMREKTTVEEIAGKVTKTDIEALESLCMVTKTQIEEMILPAVDTLPNKADIEGLGGLIKEFKEQMIAEADLTAQAFESRKIEHGGIADKVEDVKGLLDDVREELKVKLNEGGDGIEELAKICGAISEAIAANNATATVKELTDLVTREFERAHGNAEGLKFETEERDAELLEKHGEHKASIVAELTAKFDEKFHEIMLKYDDAQMAADEKATALGIKEVQTMEALSATRAVAEDLKLLIDTLGTSVTESCDRMGEDSKTVFIRVEDVHAKVEDSTAMLSSEGKAEHQLTRGEISKTLTAVEGAQAHMTEYQPKILDSIKDVLSIVGQHYEQAQRSAEELKTSVDAIPSSIPMPALPAPLPSPPLTHEPFLPEKYDDTEVHAKLDKLVEHATEAGKSAAQLDVLEQIQQQVAATASEFSAFIAAQQAAVTETQDGSVREAAEAAIALEKRVAQKEAVEAEIVTLSDAKSDLASSVQVLKREREDLALQKSRLQADLSSLHTALQIRREELQVMESRAEGLERRILDGVLDHSRSLLMATNKPASLKAMNLKRVASSAGDATTVTRKTSTVGTTRPTGSAASAVSSGVGMALKRRQPTRAAGANSPAPKGDRRILSLSTIGANNRGAGVERSMVLANPAFSAGGAKSGSAFGGLKRSHSVKSNFPVRKTSWGGTKALGMYADDGDVLDEEDKENSVLDEEDEDEDDRSDAGTERRTSDSGTMERKTSGSGTAYTGSDSYGAGSTVSSEGRRASYATSTVGTVGRGALAEDEEEGWEGEGEEEGKADGSEIGSGYGGLITPNEVVVLGQPTATDSGIGTDLPTAAFEGGSDYFKSG